MLLITCPYCGPRSELEFRYCGEAHIVRVADPSSVNDDAWGAFLYARSNTKGLHCERWRHIHGCKRFFNAVRSTVSDRLIRTYEIGDKAPDLTSLSGDIEVP